MSTPPTDQPLNLESVNFDELGRQPVPATESEADAEPSPEELQEPRKRRAKPVRRELLESPFPEE